MSELRDNYVDLAAQAEEAIDSREELARVIRGLLTIAEEFVDLAERESPAFGAMVLATAMSGTNGAQQEERRTQRLRLQGHCV